MHKTQAVRLASTNFWGQNTLSQLLSLLNKLLFFSGRQWETGRWWLKQWLAKYGLFIRLNSANGPHCLEEFDFLPFCVHAMSLSGAHSQPAKTLSTALRVCVRDWVLPQIKPCERVMRSEQEEEGSHWEEGGIKSWGASTASFSLSDGIFGAPVTSAQTVHGTCVQNNNAWERQWTQWWLPVGMLLYALIFRVIF